MVRNDPIEYHRHGAGYVCWAKCKGAVRPDKYILCSETSASVSFQVRVGKGWRQHVEEKGRVMRKWSEEDPLYKPKMLIKLSSDNKAESSEGAKIGFIFEKGHFCKEED